jgi:hypothetical protein
VVVSDSGAGVGAGSAMAFSVVVVVEICAGCVRRKCERELGSLDKDR